MEAGATRRDDPHAHIARTPLQEADDGRSLVRKLPLNLLPGSGHVVAVDHRRPVGKTGRMERC